MRLTFRDLERSLDRESAIAGRRLADDGYWVFRMGAAVAEAATLARTGGAVLLSPGCASFGMFRNEFDRGDQFNDLVRALAD